MSKLDFRKLAPLLGSCVYPAELLELLETPEDQLPLPLFLFFSLGAGTMALLMYLFSKA